MDENGYPAIKPPLGTLNTIDLNIGEIVWQVPPSEYDELTKLGFPKTGTENYVVNPYYCTNLVQK